MNPSITTSHLVAGALLMAAAGSLSASGCEEAFCIDWFTFDSGGTMSSESADQQWTLSGTIGQWEATQARASSGGGWQLTGGFWGLTLEELADRLFRDRFEHDD